MILIDNRDVLRLKDRDLLHRLSKWDDEQTSTVKVEKAKNGLPTIKMILDGKPQYLQSKYDPEREAERFAAKFEDERVTYVLFVGIGMGYHIKKYLEKYPETKFSIYEPNEEVLHAYLSTCKLEELPLRNLMGLIAGTNQAEVEHNVKQLHVESNGILKIITLPVYEKHYGIEISSILEKSLASLKDKHNSIVANAAFQKRWTINSIKNFPTVLETPNILHDIDRNAFEGKPAIIVAAGPSLNEEFENLRYIKENGLAYIFSVGSAINSLIEHGVYPDAACTYDPQDINHRVIQIIKDKKIKKIPLIFGSSVGFETIQNYPGDLLHMIVSQDTISKVLLKHIDGKSLDFVNDSPSIAVITFQLLVKLGCTKIILVGQNLAYLENKQYADGIDYGDGNAAKEESLKNALIVKDVFGSDIQTTDGFNLMRQQLEMYIANSSGVNVTNTTKGGAAIQGAHFIPLEQLINELTSRSVQNDWFKGKNDYEKSFTINQLVDINKAIEKAEHQINHVLITLKDIKKDLVLRKTMEIEKKYTKLDKQVEQMTTNVFYSSFIDPMIRVQKERLSEKIQAVRFVSEPIKKGETIVESFSMFIAECAKHYPFVKQLYLEMKSEVEQCIKEK
ncbi:motility associated factor glycosyltransferase family protein [Sporosarcina koreensis]|uniref:motility associated factor glycosyltransferase family protein n=1 Tax=Sporosarcina koreensis TaxID=334735 RepID=UPI000755AF77|nr:6-hydroxymethylpterin diphosphokinase MptE-like protein [Sporosarcina koreensis]